MEDKSEALLPHWGSIHWEGLRYPGKWFLSERMGDEGWDTALFECGST